MAENTVNNEENLNSPSSQLEEEDLQKLEADCVPVNTKKQTSWGFKKFTQWLEKRSISCDLHTVSLRTKRDSTKMFCRGENKQENRSHAKCLDWYTSCYSPYNYGTTYFKVDKHPERCRVVYTSE